MFCLLLERRTLINLLWTVALLFSIHKLRILFNFAAKETQNRIETLVFLFSFFFVWHSAGTKKPPILVDGEAVYHDLAEMVDYLDASYQKSLQPKDKETHSVGMELFIALSK